MTGVSHELRKSGLKVSTRSPKLFQRAVHLFGLTLTLSDLSPVGLSNRFVHRVHFLNVGLLSVDNLGKSLCLRFALSDSIALDVYYFNEPITLLFVEFGVKVGLDCRFSNMTGRSIIIMGENVVCLMLSR